MDHDQFAAEVYRRVPAYRAFLDAQHLAASVPHDQLPLLTKANYLLAYPTEELCWDGSLVGCHLIGASSGFSKDGAIFWPKRPHDEEDYLDGLDAMFVANYAIDRKRTLLFVCLALGTWIAGIQLASALRMLAASGRWPLTVSTPGLNLAEAVEIYARFGRHYEQVVWLTNPSSVNLVAALLDRHELRPPPAKHVLRGRRRVLLGGLSREGGCSLRASGGRSVLRLDRLTARPTWGESASRHERRSPSASTSTTIPRCPRSISASPIRRCCWRRCRAPSWRL